MKNYFYTLVILLGTNFIFESCVQRPANTYPSEVVFSFKKMPSDQEIETLQAYYKVRYNVELSFKKNEPTCNCVTTIEACCLFSLSAPIRKGGGGEKPIPDKFLIYKYLPESIKRDLVQIETKFIYINKP